MKNERMLSLTIITLLVLVACSTVPASDALLEQARSEHRIALLPAN